MPNYRRPHVSGGTYFMTQVTYQRTRWLCTEPGRKALREAIERVQKKYPFTIDAFILLPDHFHCLWTLPPDDPDLSVRMWLIKTHVTKHYARTTEIDRLISQARQKRGESNLWQRRFWEHLIRCDRDFELHCDYIHINPVKHQLCKTPQDWQFSSIHRFIAQGIYPPNWAQERPPKIPDNIGYE